MYNAITLNITLQSDTSLEEAQRIRENLISKTITELDEMNQKNAIVGSSMESIDEKDDVDEDTRPDSSTSTT